MSLLLLFELYRKYSVLTKKSSHSTRGMTLLTCIKPSLISTIGNGSRMFYHFQ